MCPVQAYLLCTIEPSLVTVFAAAAVHSKQRYVAIKDVVDESLALQSAVAFISDPLFVVGQVGTDVLHLQQYKCR